MKESKHSRRAGRDAGHGDGCRCEHGHSGHHHHHRHEAFDPATGRRFIIAITVNLLFVGVEFLLGFRYGSVGLLADAGHNLGDVGGLLISLTAFFMMRKSASSRFTYGFKKATVLAAFINSLILAAAIAVIVWESVEKLRGGTVASGAAIMATAAAGILVNGFTVVLLAKGKEHDLNIKGAYLHMLADTLVSFGVVLSGGLILWTRQGWIDPVTGLVIAAVILYSSWGLFRESVHLALDGVPENIDVGGIAAELEAADNVAEIHHLHVWAVSTVENALTAHVKLRDLAKLDETREQLKALLRAEGIQHATLEFEGPSFECRETGE